MPYAGREVPAMYKNKAFISYRHTPGDMATAQLVQKKLERYRIPREIASAKGMERVGRIFLDQTDLGGKPNLTEELQKELDSSEFLIVICSPDTCGSRWVKEEIVYFLEHHQTSELLPVISAGDPQKVLSSIFRGIDGLPPEMKACDFSGKRWRVIREEIPRLASALIGCGYDDLAVLRHYVENGYPLREKARSEVSEKSFASVEKNILRQMLAQTKTAKETDQIILVIDHNLTLWQKNAKGTWKQKLNAYCGYGQNGLSADRTEGDRTTPIGSFPILHAFGNAANPGTAMDWKDITPNSYWSGEQATYNTWVESPYRISGEHLEDYYQYKYAMAIGFNRNPVIYKKGSAIFLHCKSYDHWYTGGCVSVEEDVMRKLLLKCRNGVRIIIIRKREDLSSF